MMMIKRYCKLCGDIFVPYEKTLEWPPSRITQDKFCKHCDILLDDKKTQHLVPLINKLIKRLDTLEDYCGSVEKRFGGPEKCCS